MKKLTLLLAIATLVFIAACKDEGELTCEAGHAGKGGQVNLVIHPEHHGGAIPGATAYIEFNTQSNAGAISNYDLTVQGETLENHIHVDGLYCGEYFIYCVGYDSSISMPVFGGIPFEIKANQTGNIEVHVPVTE